MRCRTDVYIGLMRDGPAIAVATNAAAIAVRDGDFAAARATLSAVLGAASAPATADAASDADVSPEVNAPLDVAEAASLYARVLAAAGCARDGLAYSASAYQTACQAAPPGSDLRLRATATYAYLLRAIGDPAAAVPVGRDLARQLVARFGATDRRTLAAHGDLAVTLHAAGECLTGRQILHRSGQLVRSTYGPDDPLGIRMRDRLADLTRQCRPPDPVGTEFPDAVAAHTCGRPDAAASISIVDLFGDLFVGDGDDVVARPSDETVDATEKPPAVADRPVISSAGLLATLGVAIPTARPHARAELPVPPTEMPVPAVELHMPELFVPAVDVAALAAGVPVPAEVEGEPIEEPPAEPPLDPLVGVEVAETAESAATAGREDSGTPDAAGAGTELAAESDGDLSPAADVGRIDAPESDAPPWADRPTAGFPTVPIAVGLHPTWVAATPEAVGATRPIGQTSTVGVTGYRITGHSITGYDVTRNGVADLPVTHSRATFGRMRRLATHARVSDRPQRTATTSRAKTTEGE
jgi:hypothetical protein